MHIVQDLDGLNIARARVAYENNGVTATMNLVAPAGFAEGKFYPAESFCLDTEEGIRALHTVLSAMVAELDELAAAGGEA